MKVRVVFTVDLPDQEEPITEEQRTDIAAAVTEAVPAKVPGARIRWTSIGGRLPEVVQAAEANGWSVAAQQQWDRDWDWGVTKGVRMAQRTRYAVSQRLELSQPVATLGGCAISRCGFVSPLTRP
ncbi:hypothetical protein [Nocardiopsis sp. LOL_012]|uniref:hypothetical protein n=1 Tax=Nocardiopsis sp. LOL_012 TaxID=3345409 RepID=UPI003A83DD7B